MKNDLHFARREVPLNLGKKNNRGNFIGMKIDFGVDKFDNAQLTKACKLLYTNKISCLTVLNITIFAA
jgi:hypothetical protein